jgi:hypothetical protein
VSKVRRIDWSPDEWLAGTRGVLTQRETAVYDCVLNMIYSRGGEAPNDAKYIAGHFKPDSERDSRQARASLTAHTQQALDRLITLDKLRPTPDGRWLTNGRADTELGKANERIVGAAKAGFASGRARRANRQPTGTQLAPNRHPRRSKASDNNDLDRTSVRITNHHYDHESVSKNSTEAAREPAPDQTAPARAPAKRDPTLDTLAARARARFMKGER